MAPAWLTVAMPVRMEPSTTTIRVSGGTRMNSTRIQKAASKRPSTGTAGASRGRASASTRMKIM